MRDDYKLEFIKMVKKEDRLKFDYLSQSYKARTTSEGCTNEQNYRVRSVNQGSNKYTFMFFVDGRNIDVYLNGNLITKFHDLDDFTFDDQNLFLRVERDEVEEVINEETKVKSKKKTKVNYFYSVDLMLAENLCQDAKNEQEEMKLLDFTLAKLNSALSYAQIFSSVNLINENIYITHGSFISKYSITEDKIVAH